MPEKPEEKKPAPKTEAETKPAETPDLHPQTAAALLAAINALTERVEQVETALLEFAEANPETVVLTAVSTPAVPSRRRIVDYHRKGIVHPAIILLVREPQHEGAPETVDLVVFGSNFGSSFRVDNVPPEPDPTNPNRGHWQWGEVALPEVEDDDEAGEAGEA